MAILIDKDSRILVQGMTGREGSFHTEQMLNYGTKIVAGVSPGKGGKSLYDIPLYDTVRQAIEREEANVSIIFVPAPFASDAILEAVASQIPLCVCITEGIPIIDMAKVIEKIKLSKTRLIGPNCPGIITPEACKIGIMPGYIHRQGNIGLVSRSGTLTYEVVHQLTKEGLGQSTCIGIGGDPIVGSRQIDIVQLFNEDPETEGIVIVGEIGGDDEERAAAWLKDHCKKPVLGFIAGLTAPPNKRMGHAGAIISGGKGTATSKIEALEDAGVHVVRSLSHIGSAMKKLIG